MEKEVRSYKDLAVWERAMNLAAEIYRLTEKLPRHELYGLTSQMRKAAVSVPSNIAEGHARNSTKEYLHHVSFSMGSLAELETQLQLCIHLSYFAEADIAFAVNACDEVGKMLRALSNALLKKV